MALKMPLVLLRVCLRAVVSECNSVEACGYVGRGAAVWLGSQLGCVQKEFLFVLVDETVASDGF